jgi:hypothetical protein
MAPLIRDIDRLLRVDWLTDILLLWSILRVEVSSIKSHTKVSLPVVTT